jgi:hypothetical protein
MSLFAGAFIASLLKMFVIFYIGFLNLHFKCPLSGVGNPAGCPDPNGCSICLLAGSTADVVELFGLQYACNTSASLSDWRAIFDQCSPGLYLPLPVASCKSSLQLGCFRGLDSSNVCSQCCTVDPLKTAEAISLVLTFPLSAIYMAYCLISWRSDSVLTEFVQLPSASDHVSKSQATMASIYQLSKKASAITVLIKYILSSVTLFIILFNLNGSLISCNPLSGAGGFSGPAVVNACGATINTNYPVYVLICCSFMLLCLLIFDICVCQRDRLIGGAVPIGIGVILLCVVIIIVSGVQFEAISKTTVTYTCKNVTTLPQSGESIRVCPSHVKCCSPNSSFSKSHVTHHVQATQAQDQYNLL